MPRHGELVITLHRRDGFALALLAGFVLVLAVLPIQSDDPVFDAIQDAGHVPSFGLLALLARRALAPWFDARGQARWRSELLALAVTAAIGVFAEFLQIQSERNANLLDIGHDLAGAAAFLLIARGWATQRRALRLLAMAMALGLLVVSLRPLAVVVAHRQARNAAMPVLYDPTTSWGRSLIGTRHSLHWFPAGQKQPQRAGVRFGKERHAALILRRPHPDWRNYRELVLDIVGADPDTFELELRIDDSQHRGAAADRFYRAVRIGPGPHELRIALVDVRSSPADREMDMGAIRSLTLFVEAGVGPKTLYLGRIRLE